MAMTMTKNKIQNRSFNLLFYAENILKKLFDNVFPQFLHVELGETR